ncbi:MAG: TonB-dependent receptor [Polyangiaceae bacterium]|nr:TonB-dependent receptor [Polyangiaceae bacterium]
MALLITTRRSGRRPKPPIIDGSLLVLAALARPAVAHAQPSPPQASARDAQTSDPAIQVTIQGQRLRAPASPRDPTAASTVLRGESLRTPGTGAADALARVPGVQVTRTGSGSDLATASIRGSSSAQTPVYLAGIPINDDVSGTADLSVVPLWMLDRIEVFRGNAPDSADRLGMGGAVFFEPRMPKRTQVGAGQTAGSFGGFSSWTAAAVRGEGAAALISLRREQARNDYPFLDDRGTRFDPHDDVESRRTNADFVAYDAWAVGRWEPEPSSWLTVVSNAFDREQGVSGLSVVPARHARAHVQRVLAGVSARVPCAASQHGEVDGPCGIELSSGLLQARSTLRDPRQELSLQTERLTDSGTRFQQRARVAVRIADRHELALVANQAIERLTISRAGVNPGLRARRWVSRAGASTLVRLSSSVGVHGIALLECNTTGGPEGQDTCGVLEPVGRLGLRVAPSPSVQFLANLGRYVRVPTLGELFGASATVRGNDQLAPESGWSADLGSRWTFRFADGRWVGYAEVFGFAREAYDLVTYRRSSLGVVRPLNVGRARVLGAELASAMRAFGLVHNELTATVLDPRDTSEDRQVANDMLPFRSRLVISDYAEVFAEPRSAPLGLHRAAIGARAAHRSSRFADPAGLIVIAAHTTVDLELSGSFLQERVAARLAARNMFDARQSDTVGYPLPGRSYHASLEAWWW